MSKVTREQAQANREALVSSAGRLFRARGVDAVGVDEICKAAGLTHGALYAHFASKEDLATASFAHGQKVSQQRMAAKLGQAPELIETLAFYVSSRQRDDKVNCCPMLASASGASQRSHRYRRQFSAAFEALSTTVEGPSKKGRRSADASHVIAAAMIGVVAVARALQSGDPELSQSLIEVSPRILATLKPRRKPASRRAGRHPVSRGTRVCSRGRVSPALTK